MGKSDCFGVYEDEGGEWRWRVRAFNGEIVGASSEGYHDEAEAKHNAKRMQQYLTAALNMSKLE